MGAGYLALGLRTQTLNSSPWEVQTLRLSYARELCALPGAAMSKDLLPQFRTALRDCPDLLIVLEAVL